MSGLSYDNYLLSFVLLLPFEISLSLLHVVRKEVFRGLGMRVQQFTSVMAGLVVSIWERLYVGCQSPRKVSFPALWTAYSLLLRTYVTGSNTIL